MRKKRPLHSKAPIAALTAIIIIGILVYANTFHSPFLFDDKPNISENPHIRMTDLSFSEIMDATRSVSGYRPLPNISFAFNYYFHQYDTFGYHTINLAIHLATAFLLFLVARQTLQQLNQESALLPLLAAILWLVNPVHTQSVTYIVQRMTSMAAMFYLLSLFLYIKARTNRMKQSRMSTGIIILLVMSVVSGLCALASKQIAATLPVFIFLYEWYFFRDLNITWLKRQIKWIFILSMAIVVIALIYLGKSPLEKILSMYDKQDFSMGQRLLSEPRVIMHYLSLLFFPHPTRLIIDYDLIASTALLRPATTALSIAALSGLVFTAFATAKRYRLLSFAILWFLGNLAIESSFIGLALVFEHRTYLPSTFLFIAIVPIITYRIPLRAITIALFCCLIAVGGYWTWQRNYDWRDAVSFWLDCTEKRPDTARAFNNLGIAYRSTNEFKKALPAFQTAIEKDPTFERAYNNLGIILRDAGEAQSAIPYFTKALEINPAYADAHYNLGLAFYDKGMIEKAATAFQTAIRLNPLYSRAHNNMGIIRQYQGKTEEAMAYFRKALDTNPYFDKAYNNLGISFYRKGEIDKSIQCFQKSLAIHPAYSDARNNLAKAKKQEARYSPVINELTEKLRRSPENDAIAFKLGQVYEEAGMLDGAIDQYRQTLAIQPDHAACLYRLGNLYVKTRQLEKAIGPMTKLTRVLPGNPAVFYNLACLHAKLAEKEQAIRYLKTAVSKGFDKWDALKTDKDLENIRNSEYYRDLMKKIGEN
ncbi:MAG: tetratricopeptide repeat protein [Thermodesulfobacteriota bacterium]|nr:tetratricopeptide repeat protein [Thermodesulfobacteriota bacterium]